MTVSILTCAGARFSVWSEDPEPESRFSYVASLLELVTRANNLLNRENQQAISNILKDLNTLTTAIAGRATDLDTLITNLRDMTGNISEAAGSVSVITDDLKALVKDANHTLALTRGALANADQLLDEDVRALFVEARRTSKAATRLTDEAGSLVAENRRPLNEFATDGLNDFTGLVREMRELVAARASRKKSNRIPRAFSSAIHNKVFKPNDRVSISTESRSFSQAAGGGVVDPLACCNSWMRPISSRAGRSA